MRGVRGALLAVSLAASAVACGGGTREFTVLHFNDYHGQIEAMPGAGAEPAGGAARLAALAGAVAERERRAGRTPFLLFAGDACTGTATSALFQGEPDFLALRKMGIAAAVPGNHDWDFGTEVLARRCLTLGAPMVMANVRPDGPESAFGRPACTLRAGDRRIGVIGVTRHDTPLITRPGATGGFRFTDAAEAVATQMASRGPSAWDAVVVLSHCGVAEDLRIARRNPDLALIVGGHDHVALPAGRREGGVLIVQAGDRGRYLGVVRVRFGRERRARAEGSLLSVARDLPEDAGVKSALGPYESRAREELKTVVGRLAEPLVGHADSRRRETPLGDFVADALREASGADIALVNGGALRADLPAGEVTRYDLLACYPFEDTLWSVRLTGAQVRSLLGRCAQHASRGPWGGFLQISGARADYGVLAAGEIRVGRDPLRDDSFYLVACNGFLIGGGDGHTEFAQGVERRDWGLSVRDVLAARLDLAPGVRLTPPRIRFQPSRADGRRERRAA